MPSEQRCCCGRRSTHLFAGLARCAGCAADDPVEGPDQLAAPTHAVLDVLRAAGVTFDATIHVELRSLERFRATFPDEFPPEGALGLTRTLVRGDGRRAGKIVVSIVAGLPDARFRRVFAHEMGHAVMYDRGIVDLPERVVEGMAEYFAHVYLNRTDAGGEERNLAQELAENPDPVYGGGFRAVRRAVAQHGFRTVFVQLNRGDLAAVGLA
jgi:hypothetical protein